MTDRRTELGDFLKARRARVSPEDVGLPAGGRRRTPGLRREELAQLAGVGVTWYTWLEQGRPINASGQVLDAVAGTLRLSSIEREHLYRLAEATPARPPSTSLCADEQVFVEILGALDPLPAVITNTRFDIVRTNAAYVDLFHDWHALPCIHKNLLWCILTEPTSRQQLLNYDTEVPYLVGRLRSAYGEHVGDPDWETDLERLQKLSPEFAQLWSRHEVAACSPRPRHLLHPVAGELHFTVTELAVPAHPDLVLFVETPADEETRSRLPMTRRSVESAGV
ncbi:XRE family transcriptional regulator [Kribbella pittospori]|uniref:XRE family transcriptional regulator n=1 Tax=Kribbella pittospori TaxID=722689 RepID=A0A4R0K9T1_9ACTN|nr:helix-turn-helix transcriptional regulator [Kribbella pittospori]TCC56983.1 XRE family transcriptional regulator [Kribbella pittospori]